ncbi:MAG TPA: MBL fold metallo-hydrolase, partial [Chitinophagaceae bacterium]|nr:MBL fold metallo-hydrolase [Chitinophagaceae bacterium]
VGTLVTDLQQQILLVADDDKVEEVVTRLARVGYDNAIGFLQGGFESWKHAGKEVDTIPTLSADALAVIAENSPETFILDARRKSEYDAEHIVDAVNIPLDYINDNMQSVPKDKPVYVHCAGGYRSMIFCSILKARGFDNLIDVQGGFKAIKETGKFRITDYVCPTTML